MTWVEQNEVKSSGIVGYQITGISISSNVKDTHDNPFSSQWDTSVDKNVI